jgi:hypothetical protein
MYEVDTQQGIELDGWRRARSGTKWGTKGVPIGNRFADGAGGQRQNEVGVAAYTRLSIIKRENKTRKGGKKLYISMLLGAFTSVMLQY